MATVLEVMAKLSGNSSGMVGAFRQASAAAESYRDRVRAATGNAVDSTAAEAKAKLAGTQTGSGFAGGFKGAIAGLGVLAATVGFGAMVKEAGSASDATDKFKATMNFAGLDTSAITAAAAASKAYADQTVYDLPTIQNMTAQLASNGVKDYTGLTKAAGNLNAVAGGNAETFKSVAMVMTQTAGAGKLTTENWNQMANAIPGAAGPLMRSLEQAGAYTGNFREAMEKGQISADEFNEALMKLGNDPVAVEAAKSTKTFEGAIGSLQATINSGLMGALNAIKPAVTGAISGLATGLGSIFAAFGAIYTLLGTGDFTGAIGKALGVEEDSRIVDVLLSIREKTQEFFEGIKSGGGAMAPVMDTAKQVFGALKPVIDQLAPAVLGMLPALMTLVTAFSPLSIAVTALLPVLPILAGAAGALAAALGTALAAALQVVAPLIAGIVTGVAEAVTWFMSLDGGAESLSAGIITLVAGLGLYKAIIFTISAATKAWAAIQAVMNAVMAINPITLIIIGIALLVAAIVLLVMNWDNVVNFITTIWGGFINWISGVMTGFVGFLGGIWSAIVTGITGFVAGVFAPIAAGFTAAFEFITGIFTAIGGFISGVWTWIFNLLTSIGAAFWAEHGAQLTAAWAFIVAIFTAIGAFIAAVWNAIGAGISAAWNWITGIIGGALAAVWGVISSVFNAVWGFISGIFNQVAGFISGVWNGIVNTIRGVVNGILSAVSGAFNAVWGVVSSVFNNVASFISGIWNGIIGTIRGVVGQIGGVIGGIYGAVTGALAGAGGWLIGAGRNIVEGLISGVKALAGTIGNAFLSMVPGWIVGPFKAALGIASPSKLFKQFGRFIIQGLGIGVNMEEKTAVRAMEGAAAAVTAAGSGITVDVPKIMVPAVPDIAAQLALPELVQTIRLDFVGTSPLEAMAALARTVSAQGPDGYLQGVDGAGYSPATLGARNATAAQQAPDVYVNVTARVTNPWTGEEVQAFVSDVATEVTAGSLSGTARVVRNTRSGGTEGF